jgi:hypothetical protein
MRFTLLLLYILPFTITNAMNVCVAGHRRRGKKGGTFIVLGFWRLCLHSYVMYAHKQTN